MPELLSTMLYGSMKVANRKRLEAVHHRWLKRILHVSRHDKSTSKSIRERMGKEDMKNVIRKRVAKMARPRISHGQG